MMHFQCPHCGCGYHDDDLFTQEPLLVESPIGLHAQRFTLICQNCLERFKVVRSVQIHFKTIIKHE